jgi:hypothetical protein
MSKLKFDASDFNDWPGMNYTREGAAIAAQRIFDKWLEAQPEIYSMAPDINENAWMTYGNNMPSREDTHRARLVCIEEIKPKELTFMGMKITTDIDRAIKDSINSGIGVLFVQADGSTKYLSSGEIQQALKPKGGWETV